MDFSSNAQRGQVLLIVILIMVVTLTIGLSVVSRSITTLRTSKESESSQRAFSAAEAGIEKVITSSNTSATGSLVNSSSFSTSVSTISGSTVLINNGNAVSQDEGADVWLSSYPSYGSQFTGTVRVYWGQSDDVCSGTNNTLAALEIVTLSGLTSAPVIQHFALDPCNARATVNHFSGAIGAGATVNGVTFPYGFSVPITNGLVMRIIPLYASTVIGVTGNGANLPAQGQVISSTGTSGGTSRKISVYKGFPKLPIEFFPSIIFSQ